MYFDLLWFTVIFTKRQQPVASKSDADIVPND